MRIDTLRVENFRGFAEREFAFHPQFNVLIGDNATGKTATLEALAVALDPWIKGATGERARSIEKSEDVRVQANREGGVIVLDRQYPCVVEGEAAFIYAGENLMDMPFRRHVPNERARNRTKDTQRMEGAAQILMSEAAKGEGRGQLPLVAYYGTARRKGIKSSEKKRRVPTGQAALHRTLGYRDALDARIDPRLFVDWMKRQALITSQDDNVEPPSYTAVREALTALVEGATNVRYLFKAEALVVEFADGRVLPIDLLSDGQKGVLRLVGDLARRAALLNPGLAGDVLAKTPGVVLIDELGLHLHPNWQRRIVGDLRRTFPAVQFIVATHSPFVVQSLHESELIPLDTQPIPQTDNLSIQEIAEGLMGVAETSVGDGYASAKERAHTYLNTLEDDSLTPEERLATLEDKLADPHAPYADNPAFQAVLERKRIAKLGA